MKKVTKKFGVKNGGKTHWRAIRDGGRNRTQGVANLQFGGCVSSGEAHGRLACGWGCKPRPTEDPLFIAKASGHLEFNKHLFHMNHRFCLNEKVCSQDTVNFKSVIHAADFNLKVRQAEISGFQIIHTTGKDKFCAADAPDDTRHVSVFRKYACGSRMSAARMLVADPVSMRTSGISVAFP